MKQTNSSSYFQNVAGEWDSLRKGYFPEYLRDVAIAKAYLRTEMAVIDLGAGTGFLSSALAPLVKKVYAVDGSPAMLEAARKNLQSFQNIEFHEADAYSLPFPDDSIDAVFANMFLHHIPEPLRAINEIERVLVPGGKLVITDLDAHQNTWMRDEMADEWLGFERSQIRDWFREAGLVNIIVDCTGKDCCTDKNGEQTSISVFVASGTKRIDVRDSVRDIYGMAITHPSGGCCSPESVSSSCSCSSNSKVDFNTDYSSEERSSVPQNAEQNSLGCGNPVAMAGLKPGETVLDIGSGAGMDSFLAANKVGPNGRVIGVDMTPEMLDRARENARKNGFTQVEFRQGYAEELPVEDESIDVILSNCVINLVEDKGLVFGEAFRVLKPGGRLEVSDVVTSAALPLAARHHEGTWASCISGALPEQEYLDLISQAGFTGIQTRPSVSRGKIFGIDVYSLIVSARKPL